MKTFFEIIPETINSEECSLICEVSDEGVSFCIKNVKEQKFIGVAVYNFDKSHSMAGYHIALQILFNTKAYLSKPFQKTTVVYSLPEATLIPFQLFNSRSVSDSLQLLFGNLHPDATECTDLVTETEYYIGYRVRNDLFKIIETQFPDHISWHQYSTMLGTYKLEENKMFVLFYSYKIVVSLFVEGKCRLVNSFNYQVVEDVSYFLLSILKINNIENIPVELSGFIEKDSSLYLEIYKYFKDVSFAPFPSFCEYSEDIQHFPAHYFSHLFLLDPCG